MALTAELSPVSRKTSTCVPFCDICDCEVGLTIIKLHQEVLTATQYKMRVSPNTQGFLFRVCSGFSTSGLPRETGGRFGGSGAQLPLPLLQISDLLASSREMRTFSGRR